MMPLIMLSFPDIYNRLVKLFPLKPWLKVVQDIRLLSNQFAGRGGQEELENSVAFGLTFWDRNQYALNAGYEWNTMFQTMLFVQRVVELCEAVERGEPGPRELKKRFEGAFKLASDMRALQYELYMAKTLISRGCSIEWPEESKGEETFDLLVYPPQGLPPFELECKSFAGDKGFAVSLADGHRLIGALLEKISLDRLLTAKEGFASILTIILTEPVPKNDKSFKEFMARLVDEIETQGNDIHSEKFSVVEEFCPLLGDKTDENVVFNAAQTLHGSTAALVACHDSEHRLKGIRVVSAGDVQIWKEVEKVSKRALKKQLTGKRPGALALQFINDTFESFKTISEPKNKYRLLSEQLFTKDHALMLIVTNSIELSIEGAIVPYRPDAHLAEYCKLAAFYNERYDYPISQFKSLLDP
ncbi:MAG: hypothetical protein E7F60_07770 [Enterobacter hormaechei]|nr:hypothetical protein [Enterobacter hormaechei]HBC7434895.1 hypothetical protein [Enterobacter bugandensis]